MTWIRTRVRRAGRLLGIGVDYAHVGLSQPQLLNLAIRHVVRIKIRFLRGILRSMRHTPLSRAAESQDYVPDQTSLLKLLGDRMGVLVLREADLGLVIGIRDIDFPAALSVLRAACPAARLLADENVVDITGNGWRKIHTASRIGFVLPNGNRIELECYQRRAPNFWLSQNRSNREARALYENILNRTGVHPLSQLLPAPTLERRRREEAVDVVYTWVDHQDPEWAAAFTRHRPPNNSQTASDASALSRFHSSDELCYSLRSVAKNLPWARRIHVLTNCSPPDWLDITHPQLNWISHESVIPHDHLPTFSSHVIESYLHKIPGLTTRFIYMNDDFFIASRKEKAFFFGESGNSRAFLEDDGMVSGSPSPSDPDYLNASRNSARLMLRDFGIWPTRLHKHAAYALNRNILAEIEGRWTSDFDQFRGNRFRSIQDLNLPSFLYHHYALATGRAEVASVQLSLVMPMDLRWRNRLKTALEEGVDALCINEGGSDRPSRSWHSSISRFLRDHFDDTAPWERDNARHRSRNGPWSGRKSVNK